MEQDSRRHLTGGLGRSLTFLGGCALIGVAIVASAKVLSKAPTPSATTSLASVGADTASSTGTNLATVVRAPVNMAGTGGAATAATDEKPRKSEWALIDGGPRAGCAILRGAHGTSLMMRIEKRRYDAHLVAVMVLNPDWPIKAEEDFGNASFHNAGGDLQGEPVPADHGFFFYIPPNALLAWINGTGPDGFSIALDGNEIAHFDAENLVSAFAQLRACADRHFAKRQHRR